MTTAKFTQGSTLSHIIYMSSTGAIGLTCLFLVDLLDLFYLSLLGEQHLAAAVGYAGTVAFFTTSISIGLSIAMGALVSKALGQGKRDSARSYVINISVVTIFVSLIIMLLTWFNIEYLLALLGAKDETLRLGTVYLQILVPSMPLMSLAMALGASLRAVGDGKLSMLSTIGGGLVNAVLDPIFIFALGMGIEGAAIASVLSRCAVFAISFYGVYSKHKLLGAWYSDSFKTQLPFIMAIALPAMLTNIATPIGNAFVTRSIAEFGDSFMAGYATINRVLPVAFGMIFALSGAIGPILGQNYGAKLIPRVRKSLKDALWFCTGYVVVFSFILYLIEDYLISGFNLTGDAVEVVTLFCRLLALTFIFNGMMFIANASFNNLGKPKYSTWFNMGKATLGTIPFVLVGAEIAGVKGILIGQALGSVFFGIASILLAFKLIKQKECKVDQDSVLADKLAKVIEGEHSAAFTTPSTISPTTEITEAMSDTVSASDITITSTVNALSSECSQFGMYNEEYDSKGCNLLLADNDNKEKS
ncbi:MATE family efflux transporter [Moritella marina ATCC 15381]|uniref:MATE family efflux transporter n=1 Tax=Moritella marina ATCC 15381 TaxID=1202962 RepID=A0A5J6WK62_MORMI|nr:MATE family efflux transporter [Moritella marina]QFI37814.1 MATE family efflux transporter [Moritella marina ATCC 15381]